MAAASACRGPLEQVSKKVQGGGNHVCRRKEVSRTRYGERLGPRGNPREPGAFVYRANAATRDVCETACTAALEYGRSSISRSSRARCVAQDAVAAESRSR